MSIFGAPEIFLAPMPEQNQSGRYCVKQTALGNEHGERNAFPRHVVHVLVIIEGEGIEYSIPESLQDIQWLDARNKPAHEVARRLKDALTGGLA